MLQKQRKTLYRILVSLLLFAVLLILEHTGKLEALALHPAVRFTLYAVPYLVIGYDVILRAAKNIRNGQIFDEHFLMMIATFAAFAIGEYPEALAVMLFYQIGEWFQSYAVGRSRQSIKSLMEIAPEYANVLQEDGSFAKEDPEDVSCGATIIIKPGEKIPLDGEVLEGHSFLDTAALTGESVPRQVKEGDDIISGCINGEGTLKVLVTKEYENSTVARILELVENASNKKARSEQFITRFARYYTPVVTIGAVLLAILPPLLIQGSWMEWIRRACVFLIVSCPCALVISVPLSFFGGIGAASRKGVLIKGSNYLELAANLHTVVFDKTGTLTKGNFRVTAVIPADKKNESAAQELLYLAACAERYSNHPIARSILEAYGEKNDVPDTEDVREEAGHGISARLDGKELLAGNEKLMRAHEITIHKPDAEEGSGTRVHVAYDGIYRGVIVIADEIKSETKDALVRIRKAGVRKTVMLTGDHVDVAHAVAREAGIDAVYAELLPAGKVQALEELMGEEHVSVQSPDTPLSGDVRTGRTCQVSAVSIAEGDSERTGRLRANKCNYVAFVGDGVNDAPVLMRADVGFAMGALGSDAAIEAADIVLMDDSISKIADTIALAKKTLAIVRQNIIFAIGVKLVILILGALGFASMWAAVFADVGVAVLAILNAMRLLREGRD